MTAHIRALRAPSTNASGPSATDTITGIHVLWRLHFQKDEFRAKFSGRRRFAANSNYFTRWADRSLSDKGGKSQVVLNVQTLHEFRSAYRWDMSIDDDELLRPTLAHGFKLEKLRTTLSQW